MTKKHFIALADYIKVAQHSPVEFNERQLAYLADFCETTNPRFNRARWLGYIKGECGKNRGRVSK